MCAYAFKTIRLCYFHFAKAVLDYIKNNQLKGLRDNDEFEKWLDALLGCVFMGENTDTIFEYLLDHFPAYVNRIPMTNGIDATVFVNYMRTFWFPKH